jgi:1-acyl-sn-glycerol-3-phosphate acyltransferase
MIEPVLDPSLTFERRWKHALFLSTRAWVLPLLRLGLRMRVYGLRNVPRRGGAVIICNHIDWFDPILLLAASPRPILWMAKKEFLSYPVLRWFAVQAGAFPVDRGKPDRSALRHAAKLLDDGMLVGMFPEGTRSRSGGLKEPFAGASLVALRSNAPVIPCALIGTDALPLSGSKRDHGRRWPKLTAVFGEPFLLRQSRADGAKYSLEELTDAMMVEIARLLPPDYRGRYAGCAAASHPAVDRTDVRFTGPPSRG